MKHRFGFLRATAIAAVLFFAFQAQKGYAIPSACQFYGTAQYHGRAVNSGDVVKAYDPQGILCGTAYYVDGGNYAINVSGEDPDVSGDQGAVNGDAITFTINDETASTSGDKIWASSGSKNCNLTVAEQPPNAVHNGPYSANEGGSVSFSSAGSIGSSFLWNFGDGNTSTDANPSHTYGNVQSYTVTLTATNSLGSNSKSTTATIHNVAPTVSASSDAPKNEGSTVTFTGSATDPGGGGDISGYSWNFGDGNTSSQQNPTAVYADDGNYTVTLNVTDSDGGVGTKQISVTINNVAPQNVNAGGNKTANEGSSINFIGSATDPGVNDVLAYSWNFGDGGTATGANVNHAYADNGTYTVTLTVNDGDGGTGSANATATVNNVAPTADIHGPYTGTVNQPIQFHGTATDPGTADTQTYTWDLDNDGAYDDFTGQNPQKTYGSVGTYTIGLKVADDDGGFDTKSTTVTVNTGVLVTIRTNPGNWDVKFDGVMYTSPHSEYLVPGSTHSIEVPIAQGSDGLGRQYIFSTWSDGGAKAHNITVPSGPTEYTAYYYITYYLSIDNGGQPGSHATPSAWYTPGTWVTITIDSAVVNAGGDTRARFLRWEGTGNISYSGPNRTAQVQMNEPITQRAFWSSSQYLLKINSAYGNPTGGGWYNPGTSVPISVETSVNSGSGTRAGFKRWVGTGSGSYTGTNNPVNVTVNAPIVETVEWNTEFFLDLVSTYGAPKGEGWYASGTQVSVSVDTVAGQDANRRMRFFRWVGSGTNSYTGGNPAFNVTLNNPVTETVEWKQQYRLQVISERGNPKGAGWYTSGAAAVISIDTVASAGTGIRYKFFKWNGTGTGSYTGRDSVRSIIVQDSIKEIAQWKRQYYITLSIDPVGSGKVTPITAPGGWGTELDTLSLKAVGTADSGYGFFQWGGDTTGSSNPLKLVVKKNRTLIAQFRKGNVILATDPGGLTVRVDGVNIVSPATFSWASGEQHRIGTIPSQGDNVTAKYSFNNWSDGGALDHDITVPGSPTVYTAKFVSTFFLDIQSQYGTPVGEAWYAGGTTAYARIDSVVEQAGGVRQKFTGWKGEGQGSYTGSANPATVKMDAPLVQKTEWKQQYRLNVTTVPSPAPGARIEITPSGPWYDSGKAVQIKAVVVDPTYSFTGWSGGASGTVNPLSVTMNGALNVTANFKTPNAPPAIARLPDTTILEDQELRFPFVWLAKFVSDPNDPLSNLVFSLEGAKHFTVSLDLASQALILKPALNWSGIETIVVKVTDPMGLSDTDTVRISVAPIEDSPSAFNLISPGNNSVMLLWNYDSPIQFIWQKATDPDPGNYVRYSYFLSTEPRPVSGSVQVADLADTSIYVMTKNSGVYYWGVTAQDAAGNKTACGQVFKIDIRTDVKRETGGQPGTYELRQNYPNPFNPETTIRYQLPEPAAVQLRVFDLQGKMIRILASRKMDAGEYQVLWDGRNEAGQSMPSGVYVLRIEAGKFAEQKRMILIK
jgi:PKD repeat protein